MGNREEYIERLRFAIHRVHGCDSAHIKSVPVQETLHGETVWLGEVEVFALIGHRHATRCYAWSYKDKSGQHIATILGMRSVQSAGDAVQVFLAEQKKKSHQL